MLDDLLLDPDRLLEQLHRLVSCGRSLVAVPGIGEPRRARLLDQTLDLEQVTAEVRGTGRPLKPGLHFAPGAIEISQAEAQLGEARMGVGEDLVHLDRRGSGERDEPLQRRDRAARFARIARPCRPRGAALARRRGTP